MEVSDGIRDELLDKVAHYQRGAPIRPANHAERGLNAEGFGQ